MTTTYSSLNTIGQTQKWNVYPKSHPERVVCIIPARGGSRGIPRKNIVPLFGMPLLAYSIQHGRAAGLPVYVSTDDDEIAEVADKYGAVPVMRPAEISGDYAQSEDALLHALAEIGGEEPPEIVVFLQATSPIRKPEHIRWAIDMIEQEGYDSVLSGVRLHQFVWHQTPEAAWSVNYDPVNGMRPMRQLVKDFIENGSIYAFKTEVLERTGKRLGGRIGVLEMPYWCRFEIDTDADLKLVEWILRNCPLG